MTAQIIDIAGQKMVLLTRAEYDALALSAENFQDIALAVEAQQKRAAGEEYLPADFVDRLLAGEAPLKVWREHRGLTLDELGERVGRQGSMISKLENGRNEGGIRLWKALADALAVDLNDLIPAD